jgi:hypothetical protein
MVDKNREDEKAFEQAVRDVARNLWPESQFSGARMLDGCEHDGVFETEDCTHFVESTVSRNSGKAQQDIKKMIRQAEKINKTTRGRTVQCWFITQDEPTAEQRAHQLTAEKTTGIKVNAASFQQFQGRLIKANLYLQARRNHMFGSVRDPDSGEIAPAAPYISMKFRSSRNGGETLSTEDLSSRLVDAGHLVLLGDYGAGKSMTLREIFLDLSRKYQSGKIRRFPIHINLREHWGQTDAVEVLERHARRIGYESPTHLVRAWRAGLVILLIDGFDEVASQGLASAWRKLRDNRSRTMRAVREFVRDTPKQSGLVIAGRAQFFDSPEERKNALGLDRTFDELVVADFSEEQIRAYLSAVNRRDHLPSWVPSRPLLIAYLVSKRILSSVATDSALAPPDGWDMLIERIADREAEIEAGIDGAAVRMLMERIATIARRAIDGLGPITESDLVNAFKEVTGSSPEEQALVLLQRLPGLGVAARGDSDRTFVDADLADTCRAGDVARFIQRTFPIDATPFRNAECPLGSLGVDVASIQLKNAGVAAKQVAASLPLAEKENNALSADITRLCLSLGASPNAPTCVRDVIIDRLDVPSNVDAHLISFVDCCIRCLDLETGIELARAPKFTGCVVGNLEGRVSAHDIPAGIIDDSCTVEAFGGGIETTQEIMKLDLPLGVRVLVTVLERLFRQKGSARQENALYRGLDEPARMLVGEVLKLVETEQIASRSRRHNSAIWTPNRRSGGRVEKILRSPTHSGDPLIAEAARL